MSVPQVMPSPRDRIHIKFCQDTKCVLETDEPGERCKLLDYLLDFNDEMVLYAKAHELRAEGEKLRTSGKRVPRYVLDSRYGAAELIDPYEKQHAHDPVAFPDDYHPGELRPDCSGCVAGKEHYHRKSDGSPVRQMRTDVPRET